MRAQMRNTILEHDLLKPGAPVVCALSGGADSVAMLHGLMALGYPVYACHFEHGIRGEQSRADLEFVRQLCRNWQVPLYAEHGDAPALAHAAGISLETAAHRLRYAFFKRAMAHFDCETCATAHHLDDQAETLLLRLARGARDGLTGIAYRSGPYVRPLRDVTRAQVLAYIRQNALEYVEDQTNAALFAPRNRLRHLVVPQLRQVNDAAVENLCRTVEKLMQAQDLAQQWASRVPVGDTLARQTLDALPQSVQERVAYAFLTRLGAKQIGQKHLDALLETRRTGAALSLPGVTVFFDGALWRRQAPCTPYFELPLEQGEIRVPGAALRVRVCAAPASVQTGVWEQYFDLDKLPAGCVVRQRRPGDVIRPLGCGEKKLKELLIEKKIPRDRRDALPMVAHGSEILWACGAAASEKIAVTADTKRFLHIKYRFEEAPKDESPDA